MVKNPVHLGLQGLAVALIFCPEPLTTVAGVWLLAYSRAKLSRKEDMRPRKRENTLAHLYDHRMQMVGESAITYEMHKKRSGQLPNTWPVTTKVYKVPQSWNAYRSDDNQQPTRPQLLNGVPITYRKLQSASAVKLPNRFRLASGVEPARQSPSLGGLYQTQTSKTLELTRHTKSFSLLQREHIAKMLETMRYTQSFATANARRAST